MTKVKFLPLTKKRKQTKNKCPYDDWACRVYGYCGTKYCDKRRIKLMKNELENG